MEKTSTPEITKDQLSEEEINEMIKNFTLAKPKTALKFFFSQYKTKYPNLSIGELNSEVYKNWKNLSKEEMEQYELLAKEDRLRLEKEIFIVEKYLIPQYNKKDATAKELFIANRTKALKSKGIFDEKALTNQPNEEWDILTPSEKKKWDKAKQENDAWWEMSKNYQPLSIYDYFVMIKRQQAEEKKMELTDSDCILLFNRLSDQKFEEYTKKTEQENEKRKQYQIIHEIEDKILPTYSYRNPYIVFVMETSSKFREEKNKKGKNLFKQTGKSWTNLAEEDKQIYYKKAKRGKLINLYHKMMVNNQKEDKKTRAADNASKTRKKTEDNVDITKELFFQLHQNDDIPDDKDSQEYLEEKWNNLVNPINQRELLGKNTKIIDIITPSPKKKQLGYKFFYKEQMIQEKDNQPNESKRKLEEKITKKWDQLDSKSKRKYELEQLSNASKIEHIIVTTHSKVRSNRSNRDSNRTLSNKDDNDNDSLFD